jgi:GTP pyrophosphokinase
MSLCSSAMPRFLRDREMKAQIEVLRKMLLAMVEDIRVVLLRLASRTQTLRYYAASPDDLRVRGRARDAGTLLAAGQPPGGLGAEVGAGGSCPSVSCIRTPTRKSPSMLDEKRTEREQFIVDAVKIVCAKSRTGRCWNSRCRGLWSTETHLQHLEQDAQEGRRFLEVYDVVPCASSCDEVKDCYTALGIVHNLWTPISKEFDDYISNPKGNYYRSLHTAVRCPDGRSLEVQIRTWEMHKHAELGVAAHWRYKEGSKRSARRRLRREDRLVAATADVEGRSRRFSDWVSTVTSRRRSTTRST